MIEIFFHHQVEKRIMGSVRSFKAFLQEKTYQLNEMAKNYEDLNLSENFWLELKKQFLYDKVATGKAQSSNPVASLKKYSLSMLGEVPNILRVSGILLFY